MIELKQTHAWRAAVVAWLHHKYSTIKHHTHTATWLPAA
jgi:hypothetical protein